MSGPFDDLVQNEVNRVHNKFAQVNDELPVSSNLLVEEGGVDGKKIAMTTLQQFGGRRALMMIGGKVNYDSHGMLVIKWPNKTRSKGNVVRIKLRGDDTYDMEFLNATKAKVKSVKTYSGVYADQLSDIFEKQTGWYLRM